MSQPLLSLPEVISRHQLAVKKSLGQHFLLDTDLLARIARTAGNVTGMHLIEIGPGPGGLTRALLATNAAHVTAIEKDTRCIAALAPLREIYPDRFSLRDADAMALDIMTIGSSPRAIVANLPYNIGTALIVEWLQAAALHGRGALESFTVMLQKEVAERLVAAPGSRHYGRLSVLVHLLCDAQLMFDVPPEAFHPPPKVVSSIVHAQILAQPRVEVHTRNLEKVTAAAFGNRRKMLRQSLKSLHVDAQIWCDRAGVDATLRAEHCTLAMFAALANHLPLLQHH
jgi:16S rRNA (adenine1518-N6/adenine1519-N6)-dimethyltransferase